MTVFQLTSRHPVRITGGATLANRGPDTVYYDSTETVSTSNNEGSIANGSSATITDDKFIISTGISTLDYQSSEAEVGQVRDAVTGLPISVVSDSELLADIGVRDINFDGSYETGDAANWLARPPAQIHDVGAGSGFAAITTDKRVGTYAGAFTAGATDGVNTVRSEVQAYLGDTQGDDVYYAWSTKFPTGFTTPSWANILQMYPREFVITGRVQMRIMASYAGAGPGPADRMFIVRSPGSLEVTPTEVSTQLTTSLNVGSWQDFIMRVKWSTGTDGVITIWHRVAPATAWTQIYTYTGQTLQSRYANGTEPGTNFVRQGIYRAADVDASARTVYHDCFARATSFEVAERAFTAAPTIKKRKIVASRGVAAGDVTIFDQVEHLTDRRRKGLLYPDMGAFTGLAYADNSMYGFRFYNDRVRQLRLIAFAVTTAATNNDPFDLVIFNEAGTSEILRLTAVTGKLNSTGVKTLISTALAGTDFTEVALAADTVYNLTIAARNTGGTPALWGRTLGTSLVADLMDVGVGQKEFFTKATSYPIPASLSALTSTAIAPVFALRES